MEKIVQVNPEQGAVVRRIFREYLRGFGEGEIARRLREDGIPGITGARPVVGWSCAGMGKPSGSRSGAALRHASGRRNYYDGVEIKIISVRKCLDNVFFISYNKDKKRRDAMAMLHQVDS